jgi:hypothetical protein
MNLNSIVVLLCPLLNFRLHLTLSTSIDQTSQLWALHSTRLQSNLSTSPDQTTVNFEHFIRPDYSQLWALHPTRLQSTLSASPDQTTVIFETLHPTRLHATLSTSPNQTTVNYEHRNIYTCISTICLFRYTFCIHIITRKPTKHTIQQMHKLKLKK